MSFKQAIYSFFKKNDTPIIIPYVIEQIIHLEHDYIRTTISTENYTSTEADLEKNIIDKIVLSMYRFQSMRKFLCGESQQPFISYDDFVIQYWKGREIYKHSCKIFVVSYFQNEKWQYMALDKEAIYKEYERRLSI